MNNRHPNTNLKNSFFNDAKYWIQRLNLKKHPEGGYFKETYRSAERVLAAHLPPRFGGDRCFSTSIYFLLESDDFSAFHRIKSDEVWHFYHGSSLILYRIDAEGMLFKTKLGNNLENGELFQVHIKAGNWFGARVSKPDSFALVGCTVAPGFEFSDFELGSSRDLIKLYPRHREIIEFLTRQ